MATDAGTLLSIGVPAYVGDISPTVASLARCPEAEHVRLIVHLDAGPGDPVAIEQGIASWPGPSTLLRADSHRGRAGSRNRLAQASTTPWILLLDSDMRVGREDFLGRYLGEIQGAAASVVCGGFSLTGELPPPHHRLHAAQARASECVPASVRAREPGRYLFSANVLAHRDVLKELPFDEGFVGWGWEDVEWGLRVAERFPIRHIDNPAGHAGLDDDRALLGKYRESVANFGRLRDLHPRAARSLPLARAARLLSVIPGTAGIEAAAGRLAASGLPIPVRLAALKVFRAALYAQRRD